MQKHILLHMQQVAYLIGKLKTVTVGAGTLLDQCAIPFTTEVQEGRNHRDGDSSVGGSGVG